MSTGNPCRFFGSRFVIKPAACRKVVILLPSRRLFLRIAETQGNDEVVGAFGWVTQKSLTIEEDRSRAEAIFKAKEQQKAGAPLAMREYRDRQQAERDKTERLRALRVARQT